MSCYYCHRIAAVHPGYSPRAAEFDRGSEAPRCSWHWRYRCDHCRQPDHFSNRFYCPNSRRMLCRDSGDVALCPGAFWSWLDWWVLSCPECGELHPSLERAEYEGVHPWQLQESGEDERAWLSSERRLVRYPPRRYPDVDEQSLSDLDIDDTWSRNADRWDAGYNERGDANRRYSSDEVLLAFLGPVQGERILDAGSGTGYLSRLLSRRGARMTGVENARRFHEIAVRYEERDPLGIDLHHGSISHMPFLGGGTFDAVVANYVLMDVRDYEGAIAEIARVLLPGGRFVCSISHQSIDFDWHRPAADSPRKDDRIAWRDSGYFVRRAGYVQWGRFEPFLTFHRPLRDYIVACTRVGLGLRDLEEPQLTEEGRRVLPPSEVWASSQAPVSYVLKFVNQA